MIEAQEDEKDKSGLLIIRQDLGLTRSEVSKLIGVSERRIQDWESKKATPNLKNAVNLARVYGVSVREICNACDLDLTGVPGDLWRGSL